MRLRWRGWPCVLWGAGIGFAVGVAEAAVAAWCSDQPFYERARIYYSQFGVFGPYWGGVVGLIVFQRRERARENRQAAGRCGGCGYDLTGNVSGTCSECGTPVPGRVPPKPGQEGN